MGRVATTNTSFKTPPSRLLSPTRKKMKMNEWWRLRERRINEIQ